MHVHTASLAVAAELRDVVAHTPGQPDTSFLDEHHQRGRGDRLPERREREQRVARQRRVVGFGTEMPERLVERDRRRAGRRGRRARGGRRRSHPLDAARSDARGRGVTARRGPPLPGSRRGVPLRRQWYRPALLPQSLSGHRSQRAAKRLADEPALQHWDRRSDWRAYRSRRWPVPGRRAASSLRPSWSSTSAATAAECAR